MGGAEDQDPSVLKISTFAVAPLASEPPPTRMRPSCSRTAQPPSCSDDMLFAVTQLPVATCGREALSTKLSITTLNGKKTRRIIGRIAATLRALSAARFSGELSKGGDIRLLT